MTIWQEVPAAEVTDWVTQQGTRELPPAYQFLPVMDQLARARELIAHLDAGELVSAWSPAVRLTTDLGLDLGLALAAEFDERQWTRWEDLSPEEQAPEFVLDEVVAQLDDLSFLGPGGRISVLEFPPGARSMDVVVRPRSGAVVPSEWRSAEEVAASVSTMLADAPEDARLRAALGYEEASAYETQELLRPVYVFLLDRPAAAGAPGWRVASSIPASRLEDEGPPGTGASGAFGCV